MGGACDKGPSTGDVHTRQVKPAEQHTALQSAAAWAPHTCSGGNTWLRAHGRQSLL
jgi:hypothetical protein